MDKDENDITIYTYDPQGRMSSVSIGNVRIEKADSNNSLNSNELNLLNEIEEKKDKYNDEDLEIISITADTDSLKEHKDSDNNSQTKILDSEKESDCGTFDSPFGGTNLHLPDGEALACHVCHDALAS